MTTQQDRAAVAEAAAAQLQQAQTQLLGGLAPSPRTPGTDAGLAVRLQRALADADRERSESITRVESAPFLFT